MLSKPVCIQCAEKNNHTWSAMDESMWKYVSKVYCMDGEMLDVTEPPPAICPFVTEHAVSVEVEDFSIVKTQELER